jgi:CheY-like chemotaxis protein
MDNNEAVEILLVEDSPEDRELTLRALEKARLANRIQIACDGAEALDFMFGEGAYAGRPPHTLPRVVLLDLKLPKVDGLEVLQRLKADERTRLVPVVVLTSSREQRDVIESYRLGVNSYIVKPVNFERFASAVQDLGMYWLLLNERPPRV